MALNNDPVVIPNEEISKHLEAIWCVPGDGVGPLSSKDVKNQAKREILNRLLSFAENSPEIWKALKTFIAEQALFYAKFCADINPAIDPVRSHGTQCWNAGAATALARLASQNLDAEWIKNRLKALNTTPVDKSLQRG